MNPLYNTGLHLYSLGAHLASHRSPKIKKMVDGQRRAVADIKAALAGRDGFDVWIHAASLGEFEQARPLIERLRRERPEQSILLTFFSPSGYEVRRRYDKVDCVAYLPFDTPRRARAFIDAARPKMAIFVKYEFWGNYLSELKRRGVPTYIISAIFRPSQVFFKPYGAMFRRMLGCFSHLYVQDEGSRRLLADIGVGNVTVAGDTRFDRVTDVMRSTVEFPLIEAWAKDPVLIAGSSWQPDESCYIPYLNSHPELKAIIAPHEFDAARLQALQSSLKGHSMLLSQVDASGELPDDVQTLIVDSFGKLSSLYRYGTMALIGGGFGAGIHNINEAAVYGIPVVFGPRHQKFKEATDLIECGGGYEYVDAASLNAILDRWLADRAALADAGKAAGDYIKSHLGATPMIYTDLFPSTKNN